MRLLFDANLSPRLTGLLADIFPSSVHVFEVGNLAADDLLIWNYARDHGLTIVSKDGDFHNMSFVLGAPPQVIWLRVGNCSTAEIERTLRENVAQIDLFEQSEDAAFLVLDPSP